MALFNIFVFPGILFLVIAGLWFEFVDRRMYARMQHRQGPPWFQPLADFIKLLAKETIIPENANRFLFTAMPIVALTATISAFFYSPLWSTRAVFSFQGDSIVVMYLLTLPTLTFFLAGWYSTSLYSMIGAVRSLTQLFAYEIPLFMAVLAPAMLANDWSLAGIATFFNAHPLLALLNIPALGVAMVTLLGKLEKVPFDIPEAETEIVAGAFTEYSGRHLGLFRLAVDIEVVVAGSLVVAMFLPFGLSLPWWLGIIVYLLKITLVVALIAILRTIMARLRIEQMVNFCWKILAPVALAQLLINLVVKGFLKP
ncbi:MAG: NADH-quinone oxidoreductase subunit H [Kiritimatiellaeota bacterium]|nr:NADH-quinone oxidoreductase subunit H [Kiritimatiellota bacterium]